MVHKFALFAVGAALTLPAAAAHAQRRAKKPRPACGIIYLPLVAGNEWTYEYVPPPPPKKGEPPRLPLVFPPKKVHIKVLTVTPPKKGKRNAPTVIELEETVSKLVKKTTLRCTRKSLEVSPQSFFFAGEPGGGVKMELIGLQRTGKSYPGAKGFRTITSNELTITAGIKREAAHPKLKLDTVNLSMTRTLTWEGPQKVSGPAGEFSKAIRIRLEVSGKVKLNNKETLFPQNVPGALWFVKGVGLVKSYNTLGQQYQLTDIKPALPKKEGKK